jgi:pimeloyl-ACP methyl ester carboxylesterase
MNVSTCPSFVVALVAATLTACSGAASRAEVVKFQTADGIEIVGDYHAPPSGAAPAPIAILLHMYGSSRSSWTPLIEKLHPAGFAVLAIDLRGHGQSGAPKTAELQARIKDRDPAVFRDMHFDVEAARRWLAGRDDIDPARVALVGASIGCSIAFEYAMRDRSVDVVVAMSPGTGYMGLDSVAPVQKLRERPILLTATEYERKACDVLSKFNPDATVRIIGKMTAHGTRMFRALEGVEAMIVEFVSDGVGERTKGTVVATEDGGVFYENVKALTAAVGPTDRAALRWYSSPREAKRRGLRAWSATP